MPRCRRLAKDWEKLSKAPAPGALSRQHQAPLTQARKILLSNVNLLSALVQNATVGQVRAEHGKERGEPVQAVAYLRTSSGTNIGAVTLVGKTLRHVWTPALAQEESSGLVQRAVGC